jgi:hypothetical protein
MIDWSWHVIMSGRLELEGRDRGTRSSIRLCCATCNRSLLRSKFLAKGSRGILPGLCFSMYSHDGGIHALWFHVPPSQLSCLPNNPTRIRMIICDAVKNMKQTTSLQATLSPFTLWVCTRVLCVRSVVHRFMCEPPYGCPSTTSHAWCDQPVSLDGLLISLQGKTNFFENVSVKIRQKRCRRRHCSSHEFNIDANF